MAGRGSVAATPLVAERFEVGPKVGVDRSTHRYRGTDTVKGVPVTVALAGVGSAAEAILLREAAALHDLKGCLGIAKFVLSTTTAAGHLRATISEGLGESLEDAFRNRCGGVFSDFSVASFGVQALERLESVHKAGWVHHDVAPKAFFLGKGRKSRFLSLAEFQRAERFQDADTKMHVEYQEGHVLPTMTRFASVHTLLGVYPSRRDDLESLGYVMAYLFHGGHLPWMDIRDADRRTKCSRVANAKIALRPAALFEGHAKQFEQYMEYCRDLSFGAKPDYSFLRGLLIAAQRDAGSGAPLEWERAEEDSEGTVSVASREDECARGAGREGYVKSASAAPSSATPQAKIRKSRARRASCGPSTARAPAAAVPSTSGVDEASSEQESTRLKAIAAMGDALTAGTDTAELDPDEAVLSST